MIHKSSIISSEAKIGKNVKIGPFCVIGPKVILEDEVELKSHVVIEGKTLVGKGTVIYPFASIGHAPQDLKYKGEESEILIGHKNMIREYVTIQPGTEGGQMQTIVGNNNLFMVGVHIAHDCIVGNNVIFANYVSLGGHVEVGDFAIIGGLAAVQQHVKVGAHSIIGGVSALVKDLIPFGLAVSDRANLEGLNLVGMRRRGFNNNHLIEANKVIYQIFDKSLEEVFTEKVKKAAREYKDNPIIQTITEFLQQDESRVFCGYK
jgi:UDP-N-acetylglucosamine acyltransferase